MEEAIGELVVIFPQLAFFLVAVYCFYRYFSFDELSSLWIGIVFLVLILIDVIWYLFKKECFFKFN